MVSFMSGQLNQENKTQITDRANVCIGVVFGGRSSEHEVSLASARNVIDALTRAGYAVAPIGITPEGRWLVGGDPMQLLTDHAAGRIHLNGASAPDAQDHWALLPSSSQTSRLAAVQVIFPVLHGPFGEDGTIQGLLEMANLPYVGCGVAGSALAMDKLLAKQLFAAHNLPQTRYCQVARRNWQQQPQAVCAAIEAELDYPYFVKPANLGSSVGITKVRGRDELIRAIDIAARYDRKIVVEEAVPNCREIEVSVLGNDDPIASVPGEIVPSAEFYDYAAKYLDDSSRLLIPADLSAEQVSAVQAMAVAAFRAVDGTGLARVDFLLDDARGKFYLNEINTMPGFTRISMYPKLWEASGIPYPDLVDRLVQLALERHADRSQNSTAR
jgi:D-alanine-D-alanine ligase